ncbi:MAG: transporter, family, oxalate/formate antiporter [Clostridiales bacterium]|jgi:OFA family oxalate/formate antiporter-like MFS transporter|nr:transporter, family, oxalate/formate antiporter [Clostridiales bacterium]
MKERNRWVILVASIVMNLCIGSAYAWSVFQKPLISMFGWTTAQASLAFTLNLSLVPFAMIVAGRIQDSKGPKVVTLVGGIIFGLGIFLAGRIGSLSGLYLTYGVLGGIGIGTVYACTVGNTIKWFPDKRGLAGGLTAAGFGMGAVVFAPLAVTLIAGSGVLGTFSILGILFGIVIVVSSFFMAAPAAGWKPEGWTPKSGAAQGSEDKTSTEMLKTPRFYILWAMYTIGCISGLMIVGHASPIAQEQIGLSPEVAAAVVSFLGIANSSGRVFWGFISDRIGRYNAFAAMFVVSAVCLIILNLASGLALFIVGICGVAMSFGGYMGIMPSITADNFGAKYIGINYGVMFTAFGLAAFIGPRLAAVVKESSGGAYGPAFVITSVMSIAGILLALYVKRSLKKAQA